MIEEKNFFNNLIASAWLFKNDIVNEFYEKETYSYDSELKKWKTKFDPENYKAKNFSEEVVDANTKKVVVKLGQKINFLTAKKLLSDGLKSIYVSNESLIGKFLHSPIKVDDDTFKIGTEINDTILEKIIVQILNLLIFQKPIQ